MKELKTEGNNGASGHSKERAGMKIFSAMIFASLLFFSCDKISPPMGEWEYRDDDSGRIKLIITENQYQWMLGVIEETDVIEIDEAGNIITLPKAGKPIINWREPIISEIIEVSYQLSKSSTDYQMIIKDKGSSAMDTLKYTLTDKYLIMEVGEGITWQFKCIN